MKVVVIGANGQLGQDVIEAFCAIGDEVIGLTHDNVDISNLDSVNSVFHSMTPDLIVNTAAIHQVDKCEQNPETAFAVNALGPRNLAMAAGDRGAALMQISTDYVFDGAKTSPYQEGDVPRPLNAYGTTKLAGEYFVQATTNQHFVVRTSGLYGKHPCRGKGGLNFVDLMLKLGGERGRVRVVDSERLSPTSTCELAQQLVHLSRTEAYGVYHATSEGNCTWYDFAREIFAIAGLPVKVEIAAQSEFPAKVPRPKNSVLENAALKMIGLNAFLPWEEGLRLYLQGARCPITTTV